MAGKFKATRRVGRIETVIIDLSKLRPEERSEFDECDLDDEGIAHEIAETHFQGFGDYSHVTLGACADEDDEITVEDVHQEGR